MIGVIVVPGPKAAMHGLDEHTAASLLPLGDRPILQHLIELLLLQGIRSFEFLVQDKLAQIESHLGDGTRWACQIRYHLCTDSRQPFESLRVIPRVQDEPFLLIHADRFPYLSPGSCVNETIPVFVFGADGEVHDPTTADWTGAALFSVRFRNKTYIEIVLRSARRLWRADAAGRPRPARSLHQPASTQEPPPASSSRKSDYSPESSPH